MTHRNGVSSMPAMRLLPRPSPYATGCHGIRTGPLKSHVYQARQPSMPRSAGESRRGEPIGRKQIVPQVSTGGRVCEAAQGPAAPSTGATCSAIPRTTRLSGRPSTLRWRTAGWPTARSASAARRRHRCVPSEQERKRCEPEDFTDQRDDRGEGRHRAEDREGQHDGETEVLERREGREGDLIVSRDAERARKEEREGPDPKRPGEGEQAQGDEQLGPLKQRTASGARDRDDEKEEGDAHAIRPDIRDLPPAPQRT